jgi:serine/threonine-protein kinase haspin
MSNQNSDITPFQAFQALDVLVISLHLEMDYSFGFCWQVHFLGFTVAIVAGFYWLSSTLKCTNNYHSSPSSTPKMPRARTYGRRKQTATAAASAIFGSASSPQQQSPSSPARAPLRDLTTLLSNLDIRAKEDGRGEEFEPSSSNAKNKHPRRTHLSEKQQEKGQIINNDKSSDSSPSESSQNSDDISVPFRSGNYTPDTLALLPLLEKYKADTQRRLPVEKWDDVLPAGSQVVKIAEASYAEVYRVSIDGSESILKVMQLKIPSDEASLQCYTAIEISQVVSEVRVMNALTEYPGFVTFKAAHLIRGKPCASLIRARNDCERWDPKAGLSNFPNPSTFTGNSIFLAIELGDAGQVLEEVDIVNSDQLWDIFLGVVVALAAAEEMFNFEVCLLVCIRVLELR